MALELLEELCHQHGVLAAGYADGDPVAFLHEPVLNNSFFKSADQVMLESFTQGFFQVVSVFFDINL